MKKTMILFPVLVCMASFAFFACNNSGSNAGEPVAISADSLVRRGDYLVRTIGCDDCHSTKSSGPQGPQLVMDKRFGGHIAGTQLPPVDTASARSGWMLFSGDLTAGIGPWGISYAANISSDETGIGNWSEDQFIKSMRLGKQKGLDNGRRILPPMPWQNFAKLNDTDLKAIYAYLKSTPPVSNVVPGPKSWQEISAAKGKL